MDDKNKFTLLLEKEGSELKEVAQLFENSDYSLVKLSDNSLFLQRPNSPIFKIERFSTDKPFFINRIDKANHKRGREVRICKTKYEVSFSDLEEVLQEYTTLHDIQEVLQANLGGIVILNWNGSLIE